MLSRTEWERERESEWVKVICEMLIWKETATRSLVHRDSIFIFVDDVLCVFKKNCVYYNDWIVHAKIYRNIHRVADNLALKMEIWILNNNKKKMKEKIKIKT